MKRQKKPVPTKRSLPACIYRFCTLAAMLVSVIVAVVARANRQASVAPQAKNDSVRTCFSTLAGISRLCTIHVNGWLILSLLARRLAAITSETGSKIDIERGRRAANDCFFLLFHNEVH